MISCANIADMGIAGSLMCPPHTPEGGQRCCGLARHGAVKESPHTPIGAESDPLFPFRSKSVLSPSTPSQGSSNCNIKCACTRLDLALDRRSVVGSIVKLGTCSQATFFGHVCAKSVSLKFQAQITPATSKASRTHAYHLQSKQIGL
jgi:hypothetical protein